MAADDQERRDGLIPTMHPVTADPVRVALSATLDAIFGKKSRISLLEFIDIKKDFFEIAQNGYNSYATADSNYSNFGGQENVSAHVLSRQEVETTLKALFGTAGSAQILALLDLELQKQKFER